MSVSTPTELAQRLFNSITTDNPSEFNTCIDEGVDVNCLNEKGLTPLHVAVKLNSEYYLRALGKHGANMYKKCGGYTPIDIAAILGFVELFRFFEFFNVDFNKPNSLGFTVLYYAARYNRVALVKFLIAYGVDVNAANCGWSPLFMAVLWGHVEIGFDLLYNLADTNVVGYDGNRILHVVHSDCPQFVDALVMHGAQINVLNKAGATPLMSACKRGALNIVYRFLEYSADLQVCDNDGDDALAYAVKGQHLEVIKLLIRFNANIHQTYNDGNTLLLMAVELDLFHSASLLINAGAALMAVNADGETPWSVALKQNNLRMIKLFMREGGDMMLSGEGSRSLLIQAINIQHTELVLQFHRDSITTDHIGRAALHLCALYDKPLLIDALVEAKCAVDTHVHPDQNTPLMIAATENKLDALERLLHHGADITMKNKQGHTALFCAVMFGATECVPVLIDQYKRRHQASPNASTPFSLTAAVSPCPSLLVTALSRQHDAVAEYLLLNTDIDPHLCDDTHTNALMYACETNAHTAVRMLLERKADVCQRNYMNYTALHLAALGCSLEVLIVMLEYTQRPVCHLNDTANDPDVGVGVGVVDEGKLPVIDLDITDQDGHTAAVLAMQVQHLEVVNWLYRHGSNIEFRGPGGHTPLMTATMLNQPGVIKVLLELGADVHATNDDGFTCLHLAAQCASLHVMKVLIYWTMELPADSYDHLFMQIIHNDDADLMDIMFMRGLCSVERIHRSSLLLYSIMEGACNVTQVFLNRGLDINAVDDGGLTALHYACEEDQYDIVKLFLQNDVIIDATDHDDQTPLRIACGSQNVRLVQLLILNGAAFATPNTSGETLLHQSCSHGSLEITQLLITLSVDVNKACNAHNTPLHLAALHGRTDHGELLLATKAHTDVFNEDGETPLIVAIKNNHPKFVSLLMFYNADPTIAARDGRMPLREACYTNQPDVVSTLVRNRDVRSLVHEDVHELLLKMSEIDSSDVVLALVAHTQDLHEEVLNMLLLHAVSCKHVPLVKTLLKRVTLNTSSLSRTPLAYVMEHGLTTIAEDMLQAGSGYELDVAVEGASLIHLAIVYDSLNLVKLFLQRGTDVEVLDRLKFTPFGVACQLNRPHIVKFLMDAGCKIDVLTESGEPILVQAAMLGYIDLLRVVYAHSRFNYHEVKGLSCFCAINVRKLAVVKFFIEEVGVSVNWSTPTHETLLMAACNVGSEDAIRYMISKGANSRMHDKSFKTAAHYAVVGDQTDVIGLLYELTTTQKPTQTVVDKVTPELCARLYEFIKQQEATIISTAFNATSPLFLACCLCNDGYDMLKPLILMDTSLVLTTTGLSVIHFAAQCNNIEILQLCLDLGVSVNFPSLYGQVALTLCSDDAVKAFLIANGGIPVMTDAERRVHNETHAAKGERPGRFLELEPSHKPADDSVILPNKQHNSPLFFHAITTGDLSTVAKFIEAKVNLGTLSQHGRSPLIVAVATGDVEMVKLLLKSKANVNMRDICACSALYYAVKYANTDIALLLIKAGADCDALDHFNPTQSINLFCLAASTGNLPLIKELVLKGLSTRDSDPKWQMSPLMHAVLGGYFSTAVFIASQDRFAEYTTTMVQHVLIYAFRSECKAIIHHLLSVRKDFLTASTVSLACAEGSVVGLEYLLKHVDVNAVDHHEYPLMRAVCNGHIPAVKYMLELNANLLKVNIQGVSALAAAVCSNQPDMIRLLARPETINLRNPQGHTCLHDAIDLDSSCLSVLVEAGASLDVKTNSGDSPLFFAVRGNKVLSTCRLLGLDVIPTPGSKTIRIEQIEKLGAEFADKVSRRFGPSIQEKDVNGNTVLHVAVSSCDVAYCLLLIKAGVDINHRNNLGLTALHVLVSTVNQTNKTDHKHMRLVVELVRLFVLHGADPNLGDTRGCTPLKYAVKEKTQDLVEVLLDTGSDPNTKSDTGVTTLHLAVETNHLTNIGLLLERKADVHAVGDGLSVGALAAAKKNPDLMRLLAKYATDPTDVDIQSFIESDSQKKKKKNKR